MIDNGTTPVRTGSGPGQLQRSLGTPNSMLDEFDF